MLLGLSAQKVLVHFAHILWFIADYQRCKYAHFSADCPVMRRMSYLRLLDIYHSSLYIVYHQGPCLDHLCFCDQQMCWRTCIQQTSYYSTRVARLLLYHFKPYIMKTSINLFITLFFFTTSLSATTMAPIGLTTAFVQDLLAQSTSYSSSTPITIAEDMWQAVAENDLATVAVLVDKDVIWHVEVDGKSSNYRGSSEVLAAIASGDLKACLGQDASTCRFHDAGSGQVIVIDNDLRTSSAASTLLTMRDGKIVKAEPYTQPTQLINLWTDNQVPMIMIDNYYMPVTSSSPVAVAHFYKAEMLMHEYKLVEALASVEKAVSLDKDFLLAALLYAYLSDEADQSIRYEAALATDASRDNEAEQLIRGYLKEVLAGGEVSATKYMLPLSKRYAESTQALLWASNFILMEQEDPDAVVKLTKRIVKRHPDFAVAYNLLGYAQLDKQDLSAAKEAFDRYLALAGHQGNPYDSMGDYYINAKDYNQAAYYYDQAVQHGMQSSKDKAAQARALAKS